METELGLRKDLGGSPSREEQGALWGRSRGHSGEGAQRKGGKHFKVIQEASGAPGLDISGDAREADKVE